MEKKILPEDLFGPPSAQSRPISEPKKAKDRKGEEKSPPLPPEEKNVKASPGRKNVPLKGKDKEKRIPKLKNKPKREKAVEKTAKKKDEKKHAPPLKKKAAAAVESKKAEPETTPAVKKIVGGKRKVAAKPEKKKFAEETPESEKVIKEYPLKAAGSATEPEEKRSSETEAEKDIIESEKEEIFERCPVCGEQVPEKAHVCPHCYVHIIKCPYCGRRAGALENPKMITEQRFNRILKQYTLFGLALPSMPVQPILDCSECRSRVIICETCNEALKHSAQSCPICGEKVRYTKLLINPFSILEAIIRRPDALRGLQKLIEYLLASQSK